MTARRRTDATAPKQGRGSVLRGTGPIDPDAVVVELNRESARQKEQARLGKLGRLKAAARDPELHALARRLDRLTANDHKVGGRPRAFDMTALLVFGAAISIYGSASAAAAELSDPDVWDLVWEAMAPLLPPGQVKPAHGPRRYHWEYCLKRRLAPNVAAMVEGFSEGAAHRTRGVGLADPIRRNFANPHRDTVLVIDGKVMTSPQGGRESTIDRKTGEVIGDSGDKARRRDAARGHHVQGDGSHPYGTHYAIASLRSPLSGHRVITGIAPIPDDGRGEGWVFVELAIDAVRRNPGISHIVTDGALRGIHIEAIQRATGAFVVVRPRHKAGKRGGVKIGDEFQAVRPLPIPGRRANAFAACGGHDLWAGGGHVLERRIASDGTATFAIVATGHVKRDQQADGTWKLYVECRLPCHDGTTHIWHESLTAVATDKAHGFNRAEYLRAVPTEHPDFDRIYGMRADAESLNAEIEHSFYKQRIPAWGHENKMVVMTLAALAHNSRALHVWNSHAEAQAQAPPGFAA